ncbi:hypothetical protein Kpol_1060p61 [Vanderwaltozyma polyspora DSM 70294]|uniref:Phosphatidic acid phosphatase type 2/haloperoxidase domain-containing protein n=1 Tax=Vanderwaltozyma polyspora (strain ATCC 22028 / DSM 70294 / BCRC 21397 / CBS 2163 / NBRC 10782 / NRRL Y-8283 / UCD 57-17) TaxID=436907 RepID=A7TK58_VANPO|nr:uncharacterized protein Kpol_1060p61 [Vanderwaltozyma polyspora DSM 70294]EDO17404.1 hypothetical protein Kpol_1060p61 [Vanderwaltozyma polyspora DSM 70294]
MTGSRSGGISNANDFLEEYYLNDPGNHPPSHFKDKMSDLRFNMRNYLLKFTDTQSIYLAEWQKEHRTISLDTFFAYTALLASHTFYVLFLPIPPFIGQYGLIRDLVYILGYSIYISGYLKDYWCLPRPKSPPLHRITLSAYTSKEYGAPSSHTANATGVTLLLILRIYQARYMTFTMKCVLLFFTFAYDFTLIIGRLYCGMHGLIDLISGAIIGILCFAGRIGIPWIFKNFKSGDYLWYPIFTVCWGFFMLFNHVKPIDECPCFEDSVAFIGVLAGLDFSNWFIERYDLSHTIDALSQNDGRITPILLKLAVGIPCVIIWKYVIGKPLVYLTLQKIIGVQDDRPSKKMLRKRYKKVHRHECLPYIGVAKLDIYGRFFIYAGIPITVLLISPIALQAFGLINL